MSLAMRLNWNQVHPDDPLGMWSMPIKELISWNDFIKEQEKQMEAQS